MKKTKNKKHTKAKKRTVKAKIAKTSVEAKKWTLHRKIILGVVFYLVVVCTIAYIQPKKVVFSYNKPFSCVRQLTFLPDQQDRRADEFDISYSDQLKIGDFTIISATTCFEAKQAPKPGSSLATTAPFGIGILAKRYSIDISDRPIVLQNSDTLLSEPISTIKPLTIELDKPDEIFNYRVSVNKKDVGCDSIGEQITCSTQSLELAQGKSYSLTIYRYFDEELIDEVLSQTITTVRATKLVKSSIKEGQTIFDKSKSFEFEFDKQIVNASVILEKINDKTTSKIDAEVSYENKKIAISLSKDLDRDSNYRLKIQDFEATDGSTLLKDLIINFKMSDGPTAQSINAGSYSEPQSKTIVITLDQDIETSQTISSFVSVSGVSASVSKSGNQIYVTYSDANFCQPINIQIKPGLKSVYGIEQKHSWSFYTRTVCHTTSVIGYSVGGRAILAYTFGSGSNTILYTGAIHGSEISAKYLMDEWIDELERNFDSIPSDRKVVVVPAVNPDGLALGMRTNLNGVDLNRNFDTFDWQPDTYSGSQVLVGGGGSAPMSEPEAKAIGNFTIQLRPRLTMSFHSAAGYAIGNQAGNSASLAATYSNLVGYSNMTGVIGAFSYPITGTYDDWLRDRYGLTSVLVELSTNYSSEFWRNKTALWTMLKS